SVSRSGRSRASSGASRSRRRARGDRSAGPTFVSGTPASRYLSESSGRLLCLRLAASRRSSAHCSLTSSPEQGFFSHKICPETWWRSCARSKPMGLEGMIVKRKNSPYVQDERSPHWLKLKLEKQQEFVTGGDRPGGSSGLDAVLVAYYDNGKLHFVAKARACMVPHVRRELLLKLKPLHATQCPFVDLPNESGSRWGSGVSAEDTKDMQWIRPQLVAQFRFVEWNAEGRLRHPALMGLRLDKDAEKVVREPKR